MKETLSISWFNMSLSQTQDVQVTALDEVMQEKAFIANGPAITKAKTGQARVYTDIATQQQE